MTIDTKFHRGLHRIWIVICCSVPVVYFILEDNPRIPVLIALLAAVLLYNAGVIAFYVLWYCAN